jgi:cytoskeleton protein RodZ
MNTETTHAAGPHDVLPDAADAPAGHAIDAQGAAAAGDPAGAAPSGAAGAVAGEADAEVATAADAAPPSAGAMLREARDRLGLSIGEVANHLKLSLRQVEAMEADAFDRLPSPMFVRGFARSYARLLQLDPGPLLQALERQLPSLPAGGQGAASARPAPARQPAPAAIPFPSPDQPSRRLHAVAALLAAGVVGFLAWEWFGPLPRQEAAVRPSTQAAAEASPAGAPEGPAQAAAGDAAAAPEGSPGDASQGSAAGAGAADAAAVAGGPPAPGLPIGASSSAPSEIGSALGTGPRTVRLSFDRESWVEIRDARGRLIFSQLNPPGSSQEVQGEPPLSLVVGNARSVRLAYGGRDVDLSPHIRVDVARFTLD